jgi:hypothetical protein
MVKSLGVWKRSVPTAARFRNQRASIVSICYGWLSAKQAFIAIFT